MIKKIKNILVPLDGSKNSIRGLDVAINLARQSQAKITGIYVKSLSSIYTLHPLGFMSLKLIKEAKKILESAKIRAAKKGILFNHVITEGYPAYEIVKYAHNKKIDIIVIGARGRGAAKEIFLGSTSNYVVHKAKRPVILVK